MLSNSELKRHLNQELDNAVGYCGGDLQDDRDSAMDYYQGEAVGDLAPPDIAGRSSIVDTTVADVIHWIMPQVIKPFVSSERPVRFDPMDAGDEERAQQETDYVNWKINQDNGHFLTFYTWFFDALLQKNGSVKVYWDEAKTTHREEYRNLTDIEMGELLADDSVEPVEHTENEEIIQPSPEAPQGGIITLHDIVIQRTNTKGVAAVDPIPPENLVVNADHKSIDLDGARFVAHEEVKTASELLEIGISREVIDRLPKGDDGDDSSDYSRNTVTDEQDEDDVGSWALQEYTVYDIYALIDKDGNGIAERRNILYVRGADPLIDEACDDVPVVSLTPYIMPHRWVGRGIWDRIKEIQKLKTQLLRNLLDNVYLQNNQRTYVNTNAGVNFDDLLTNRPGGVVRGATAYQDAMNPIVTPNLSAPVYDLLGYADQMTQKRTGVSDDGMGQNMNLANDTAHGIERLMTAKEELVAMITRTFAETGVKTLYLKLHALLQKHQNKEEVIKLRGRWVPVNPSEWRERTSMTVKVGLGTGEKTKQQMMLSQVITHQKELMQMGSPLVQPNNLYSSLEDFAKASGATSGKEYFTDPANPTVEMQQQQQQQMAFDQKLQEMQQMMEAQGQQAEQMIGMLRQELQKTQLQLRDKEQENAIKGGDLQRKVKKDNRDFSIDAAEIEIKSERQAPGSLI